MTAAATRLEARLRASSVLVPGLLVSALIAISSRFISDHYGAPAMLMALLFGIALNFLSETERCDPGIGFSARTVLRTGVALLGVQISFEMLGELGVSAAVLVVGSLLATIGFGLAVARLFGFRYRFAFLSAGAVAICGASAAIAIAAILPKDERSEERLVFTVVGVTVLSTAAMILYPLVVSGFGFDDRLAGIYLGATIHDVAQVVGAGFSVSDATGETATLVKLLRVAMLAPVVVLGLLVLRVAGPAGAPGERTGPILPVFLLGFIACSALASTGLLPAGVIAAVAAASRWMLLMAIAAVGLRTRPAEILRVGPAAIGLLVAETLFLAVIVALGLVLLGPGGAAQF
ncbi:YeiH family protein [Rhodovulum sp. YNF3179]|uniref:YeiH family protein n=1 Tax=Rhodovulum sp. YNF3179 TaxID=3425127 RepID=UPI003D347800